MTRSSINVPADVIAQRGIPIKLIDGSEARAVVTFSTIMTIEEEFGSIADALAAINGGAMGKVFGGVASVLAACLEHEPPREQGRLDDVDVLRNLLDPMQFSTYVDAAGNAISAAFPAGDDAEAGEGDADPQQDSPGESGTTSPR